MEFTLALGPRSLKADKSPSAISSPQSIGFLFSMLSLSLSSLSSISLGLSVVGGRPEPGGSIICVVH